MPASIDASTTDTEDDGTLAAKRRCTAKSRGGSKKARRQCVQSYLDQKASLGDAPTTAAASAARCPLPTDDMPSAARQKMARCLRQPPPADSATAASLDDLLHRHLWDPPTPPAKCQPFAQQRAATRSPQLRACLQAAGDAQWTASGLVDSANATSSANGCDRRWTGAGEARCLLGDRDVLFLGNSVVRRQMYTVLDLLAGRAAHRLRPDGEAIRLSPENASADAVRGSRLWDLDGHAHAYHAAQLFTIDLTTGEHRFELPHSLCGVEATHSNFNAGRHRQWWNPGRSLDPTWGISKWKGREWRPLLSMSIHWPAAAHADGCSASQARVWAGSFQGGLERSLPQPSAPNTPPALAERVRMALLSSARAKLIAADASAAEWVANVSAHVEQPEGGMEDGGSGRPSAWLVFPSYHGERESFNGYCGEPAPSVTPCECSDSISTCTKPPCKGRRLCKPLPRGSARFVDAARALAATLASMPPMIEAGVSLVGRSLRVTPLYDDCWSGRDRCQGFRPCHERLDSAFICRSTALLCPASSWAEVLRKAKAWVPPSHTSASLLYIYDGQTQETADATFETWGPHSVGYGSHAIIFGPQFASQRSANTMRRSLALMRRALKRAATCPTGKSTLAIFRSPAFNFDPVNSFAAQGSFARRMRPSVEADDFAIFLDNYQATYSAAFPSDAAIGARFDRNSAFHYLDAGRYLMAQLVLHVLRLLV